MKELTKKLTFLKQNGKESSKNNWVSPAELEKFVIKKERRRFFILLIISNFFVWLILNSDNETKNNSLTSKIKLHHVILNIDAKLLVPLSEDESKISILNHDKLIIQKAFLLPKAKQKALNENGPWKVEIHKEEIHKILNSKSQLKIIPRTNKVPSTKGINREISF
jgi:hypothetical protein